MPGIATPGMEAGFSPVEAAEVAGRIDLRQLLAYADAVNAEIISWVGGLREEDLDANPTWRHTMPACPSTRRRDSGPERDQAVGDVGVQPVWLFLTSVCVTHLHRHLGELDLTLGILTGRAGSQAGGAGMPTELVE